MTAALRRHRRGRAALDMIVDRVETGRGRAFGFPHHGPLVDFRPLERRGLGTVMLNNIGDPYTASAEPRHVKEMEVAVVDALADWFGRPRDDRWGCITTGSTGAIRHGIRLGRDRYPRAPLVYTDTAHYCVPKIAHTLRMEPVRIGTDRSGEMDYRSLADAVRGRRGPVVVLATAGTAMTEAVDRVTRIRAVLPGRPVYVHMDAALSGPVLAADPRWRTLVGAVRVGGRPVGADPDSLSFSGHKFLGLPAPTGVLLARASDATRWQQFVPYIAAHDTTDDGSRDGRLALLWWWALHQLGGTAGLAAVARRAVAVAEYAAGELTAAGWDAVRAPWGLTVAFKEPPQEVLRRFGLAVSGDGWARWLAMPGRGQGDVDALVVALRRYARDGAMPPRIPATPAVLH